MNNSMFCGAEHEEAQQDQLLSLAMDKCWVGMLVADKDGHYLYSNRRYREITGYSSDMIQQLDSKTMGQNLIREQQSAVELVLQQKCEIMMRQTCVYSDSIWLVDAVPCFDESGEVAYVVCSLMEENALRQSLRAVDQARQEEKRLYRDFVKISGPMGGRQEKIIYKSAAMHQVMWQINKVAGTDATVFFRGESGVGKELFARRLHDESKRREQPFIRLNCSAIPESLMESELFGYEGGTFTGGNSKGKKGLLEYAQGGTMLLDEIGSMPLPMQAKLLRVLQEREFTRLGGHQPIAIDIRFVAATNSNIEEMIRLKTFREDLYYRLNIIPIRIPTLEERKEDIPLLIHYFVEQFNETYSLHKSISPELVAEISQQPFPGNVRQLKNMVERAMLLSDQESLTREDFGFFYPSGAVDSGLPPDLSGKSLEEILADYEKYILTIYRNRFKSSRKVAEQLQMNQSSIVRKFQKYNL